MRANDVEDWNRHKFGFFDTNPIPQYQPQDRPQDNSTSPQYYTQYSIQPIDVIEAWNLNFSLGCVVKYIARYRDKGGVLDLKKAAQYLERVIVKMETGDNG